MTKLKLDVDALRVESFGTTTAAAGRGTVLGESGVRPIGGGSDPLPQDTGCTAPCMSGESECPIESCGSGCDTNFCAAVHQPAGFTD